MCSLGAALAPAPLHAQTLNETVHAAERNNPVLEEARLALRAAREDRVQAHAGYLPQIDFYADIGVERSTSHLGAFTSRREFDPSGSSIELRQSIFAGGRRFGVSGVARA